MLPSLPTWNHLCQMYCVFNYGVNQNGSVQFLLIKGKIVTSGIKPQWHICQFGPIGFSIDDNVAHSQSHRCLAHTHEHTLGSRISAPLDT